MFWNKSLSELQFHLAHLFPLKEDIIHLAGKAGLPPGTLTVADKGIVFWFNVLSEARQQGLLDELIMEARRLYPQDELLSSFNALLIDKDNEVRLDVLKDLCADVIREGQFREALPLVEEILAKSPTSAGLEEDLVVRFAETNRHLKDGAQRTGRKRTQSLRYLEAAKTDLIALIQAL